MENFCHTLSRLVRQMDKQAKGKAMQVELEVQKSSSAHQGMDQKGACPSLERTPHEHIVSTLNTKRLRGYGEKV